MTALLRFLPHIGIALALLGAIWWLDNQGYQRAMDDRDRRDAEMLNQIRSDQRQSEQRMAMTLHGLAETFVAHDDALERTNRTLQPIIIKEAARDPRLTDPAAGLTPGMLEAINSARATGACARSPAGGIVCALPPAAAAGKPVDR